MNTEQRIIRLLTAPPATLARVDAVLAGTDGKPDKADADVRLVTFTEAAEMLNISRPTVYRMVKLGRLEAVPLDGVSRIRLKSVIDFANGLTHNTTTGATND